jgi:hypothetical protein
MSHGFHDLRNVSEIVDDPCCQQMAQGNSTQVGMLAREGELFVGKLQGMQSNKTLPPQRRELIEQLLDGFVLNQWAEGESVKAIKSTGVLMLKDSFRTRHPVGSLAVREMPYDIGGAEGFGRLPAVQPHIGFSAKHCIEDIRRGGQDFACLIELEFHRAFFLATGEPFIGLKAAMDKRIATFHLAPEDV